MDAVIIKSEKDDINFDNLSFIVDKKFGLTDGTVVKTQLNVVWEGKLFPSMLEFSSEHVARLFYNNTRPTTADNGSGKRMMSDAEVDQREAFLKGIEGIPYTIKASEVGVRTAKAKELTFAELHELLQNGTEEQKTFAASKMKEKDVEGAKARQAVTDYENRLKKGKAITEGLKSGITVKRA